MRQLLKRSVDHIIKFHTLLFFSTVDKFQKSLYQQYSVFKILNNKQLKTTQISFLNLSELFYANVNIADIYGAVTKAYWSELSLLLLDSVFQICEKLIKFNPVRSHSIICDSQAVNEDKLARIACLLVLGNVGKLDVGIFSLSDQHYLGRSIHAL